MSNAYDPKPGDDKLQRGTVTIDKAERSERTGKTLLAISGSLPTPCYELRLRVPPTPGSDGVVRIEAWSVTDPDRMCAQVLHPFAVEFAIPGAAKFTINGRSF
jgi:hypothetical protein